MWMTAMSWSGAAVAATAAASAPAADQAPTPPAIERVMTCRALAAADARLACYDREVTALNGSVERGAVVVIDKAEVKKAQRERFGLAAPGLDLFAGPDGGRLSSLAGAIASAGADGYGKWIITLADGSRWHQIDDYSLSRAPRSGQAAVITRGAIGSFKMSVAGQAAIRVRRDR